MDAFNTLSPFICYSAHLLNCGENFQRGYLVAQGVEGLKVAMSMGSILRQALGAEDQLVSLTNRWQKINPHVLWAKTSWWLAGWCWAGLFQVKRRDRDILESYHLHIVFFTFNWVAQPPQRTGDSRILSTRWDHGIYLPMTYEDLWWFLHVILDVKSLQQPEASHILSLDCMWTNQSGISFSIILDQERTLGSITWIPPEHCLIQGCWPVVSLPGYSTFSVNFPWIVFGMEQIY